ncbi:hypothetical protein A245_38074, partial [Pseudomonas syringae pv. actinidiae ICMP 19096]
MAVSGRGRHSVSGTLSVLGLWLALGMLAPLIAQAADA